MGRVRQAQEGPRERAFGDFNINKCFEQDERVGFGAKTRPHTDRIVYNMRAKLSNKFLLKLRSPEWKRF